MPTKPITASKVQVRDTMKAFEKALKNATGDDGTVDMKALKSEAAKVKDKDLAKVFSKSIDVLEQRFARTKRVDTGCGSTAVKSAPKSLKATEVKSVFAALVEAKSKGLDKIDADGDGKITPAEAKAKVGKELADKLASAAARAATHAGEKKPRSTSTSTSSSGGSSGTVGC